MTRHQTRSTLLLALLAGAAGALLTTAIDHETPATAAGLPTTTPFTYSGLLADAQGKPLSAATAQVGLSLHTAQSGGTAACTTAAKQVTLNQGRFTLTLHADCQKAFHDHPDLYLQLTVNGTTLPRTKVGAVPYALETDDKCPSGYTYNASESNKLKIVLCERGKDQMVKVGDFWVDRYEMSIVDETQYKDGTCDGAGTPYGQTTDNYPSAFPDNGNWTAKYYACSINGVIPSANMTWFQAQQACINAGKHLCTNGEWQAAAAGTHDPGSNDGSKSAKCNTSTTTKSARYTGKALSNPPSTTDCVSNHGAEDMIGNLWEWVDLWGQAGKVNTNFSSGTTATPWRSSYGDGGDKTWNLNGEAFDHPFITGMPAAAIRGGDWQYGTGAGVFAMGLNSGPSLDAGYYGARCCRR